MAGSARIPAGDRPTLAALTDAIGRSWDAATAYRGVARTGIPALGQCYPTARLVEWFLPAFGVVAGHVDTGSDLEWHFWNRAADGAMLDLTWSQFPPGSVKLAWEPVVTPPSATAPRRGGVADCCASA